MVAQEAFHPCSSSSHVIQPPGAIMISPPELLLPCKVTTNRHSTLLFYFEIIYSLVYSFNNHRKYTWIVLGA